MLSERRRTAIRATRTLAGIACALVIASCVAVAFSPVYAAVAGTLSCALVACSSFYAAYEGFDEWLRRDPKTRA